MKKKDYLLVVGVPLAVLMIPLVAMQFTTEVKWTAADFLLMGFILSVPTFLFRLLVTRPWANLSYRLGAGLAIGAACLMTWVNLAVQIIGDRNPANLFYFGAVLFGLFGIALARCQPAGLAKAAFALAGVVFLIPVVALLAWPQDFSPGVLKVFGFNGAFVALFVVAGSLFRHAAGQARRGAASAPVA